MKRPEILIVEDNEINAIFLSTILEKFGYRTAIAPDGHQAVDACRKELFHLIFMDYQLPGSNGSNIARLIRGLGGNYEKVPMVLLTALDHPELKKVEWKKLFCRILKKPFQNDEIIEIINSVFPNESIKKTTYDRKADGEENAIDILCRKLFISRADAKNLLFDFQRIGSRILSEMEQEYKNRNYEQVSFLAHQMKGIGCTLHLSLIQEIGRKIEKNPEQNRNELGKMRSYIMMLHQELLGNK